MDTLAIQTKEEQKALPVYFPKTLPENKDAAINQAIKEHETDTAEDWELKDLATWLYHWYELFNQDFFKDQPVPMPVLSFEKVRVNTLGSYTLGRNSLGLKENININHTYLNMPKWRLLSVLLHELCHAFEWKYFPKEQRTCSWYHKRDFRLTMAEFGLLCNEKGIHEGIIKDGKFYTYLKAHGISFAEIPDFDYQDKDGRTIIPIDPPSKKKGKSKLKKWTCACTNIRAAVEVDATCNKCGEKFELQT